MLSLSLEALVPSLLLLVVANSSDSYVSSSVLEASSALPAPESAESAPESAESAPEPDELELPLEKPSLLQSSGLKTITPSELISGPVVVPSSPMSSYFSLKFQVLSCVKTFFLPQVMPLPVEVVIAMYATSVWV